MQHLHSSCGSRKKCLVGHGGRCYLNFTFDFRGNKAGRKETTVLCTHRRVTNSPALENERLPNASIFSPWTPDNGLEFSWHTVQSSMLGCRKEAAAQDSLTHINLCRKFWEMHCS